MQLLSMASADRPINGDAESERELIDAEFESMVAGLSLDQSAPTTFLDELDAVDDASSERELYAFPAIEKKTLQERIADSIKTFKSWWSRNDSDEGDGAVL
ncbi:unannotated protein [freshwater metagenome]|uniref:Unannotated protein n=1 Tax=freshwater metagenome TaxID=449393 RepID=A0A6J5Z9W8_9ZZZZ|nr:hypothetical protein [Actinomycetota bacterium]